MSANENSQARTGLGVKIVLAVSLALNLMVVGVIVGSRVGEGPTRDGKTPDHRERFDPALGPFSRALPDEYRRAADAALRERAGDPKETRAEIVERLGDTLALLRATPFDAEALDAAMKAQGEVFAQRGELGRVAVLEQIAAMSDAERAELADKLEKGFSRAMDRARPGGKPDGRP